MPELDPPAIAQGESRAAPGAARPLLGPPHAAGARALIEEGVRGRSRTPTGRPVYDPGAPCTIEVDLATPDHADRFRHRAGVTIREGRSLSSAAGRWWDAWRQFYL